MKGTFTLLYQVTKAIVSKHYVTHMGGVKPLVTKRYIWVGGAEKKYDFQGYMIIEWPLDK